MLQLISSLTVHEKREMFYHLQSDPDIQSLNISPVTSLQRSYKPLTHKQTSSDSCCSGGITFSPENSLTYSQRPSPCLETSLTCPDHELTRPEHIPSQSKGACPTLSTVPEATPLPPSQSKGACPTLSTVPEATPLPPSQSEGACPTLSTVPEATPLPTASLTTQRQVSDDGTYIIECHNVIQ